MFTKMRLDEFLKVLATASGDEALKLVSCFQDGSLCVEGRFVEDFVDEPEQ
jgi:hypothetical protein